MKKRKASTDTLAIMASQWLMYARGITPKEAVAKAIETYMSVMEEIERYADENNK